MTATKPTEPTNPQTLPSERAAPERLGLSATQLVASGLAAMSATVAASYFGVAGTVIGAALGSVVTVIGNAVYGYGLRRTRSRVRRTLDVAVGNRFATDPARVTAQRERAGTDSAGPERPGNDSAGPERAGLARPARDGQLGRWLQPKRLALAVAGLFVAVLAVTTGFELASGQPLSATVTGKHGAGVSIGGGSSKKAGQSTQPATPSTSGSGTSGSGTSGVGSATPTVTVTVTPSGSASPAESSAPASSATPSATASPTGSPSARG
jgi:hypothetical protein